MSTDKQRNNSDKRLKNLKPWKKGQSGNVKGRPKNSESLTVALRELLAEVDPKDGKTKTQILAEATYGMALKGHQGALREIWQRIEGTAPEQAEKPEATKISIEMIKQIREDAGLEVPREWDWQKASEGASFCYSFFVISCLYVSAL